MCIPLMVELSRAHSREARLARFWVRWASSPSWLEKRLEVRIKTLRRRGAIHRSFVLSDVGLGAGVDMSVWIWSGSVR